MDPDAPAPRLCHLVKWPDFDGYGFNLHAEKNKPGQFIGKVDDNSPAQAAGLRCGDRIIEVNNVNIANENHKQVVERIKAVPGETKLLVVDDSADKYYRERKTVVKHTMSNVVYAKTPATKKEYESQLVNKDEKRDEEKRPETPRPVEENSNAVLNGSVVEEVVKEEIVQEKIEEVKEIVKEDVPEVVNKDEKSPVKDPYVNQFSVKESPVLDPCVNQSMVKESPVKESPVKESPMKESPVEESLVKESPVKESPVEESPVKESPVKDSPKMSKDSPKMKKDSPKMKKDSPKMKKDSPKMKKDSPKMKKDSLKMKKEILNATTASPKQSPQASPKQSPRPEANAYQKQELSGNGTANGTAKPTALNGSTGSKPTKGQEILNLNMSAQEMRELIASRSKNRYDPKKEAMDLKKKYAIVQSM